MDKMNNENIIVEDISEVADDIIVQNFEKLQDSLFPADIFNMETVSLKLSDNRGLSTLHLKQQQLIDDVLQMISDNLNIYLLYSYKSKNNSKYKVVLYSLPLQDEMFIIGLESEQYGIIEEINISLFDTLEVMFSQLKKGLESITELEASNEINLNEKQTLATLYSQFI